MKIDDSFASQPTARSVALYRMWFIFAGAAGVVALTSIPQTRNQVKDVPWMAIALAVGLGAVSDSIKNIGTKSRAHFEEPYDIER